MGTNSLGGLRSLLVGTLQTLSLDLSTVRPHVSGPNHVKVMNSVHDLEQKRIKVHKAYLVSCVNSRVDDLAQAAGVLRGKRVAPGVEFYIAAASSEVQAQSEARGDWQTLLDAGAKPLPAGCGPCVGTARAVVGAETMVCLASLPARCFFPACLSSPPSPQAWVWAC